MNNTYKMNLERIKELPKNALLKVRPDLWEYWDFEKNEELELDIYTLTYGSDKKAWWNLPCGHTSYKSIKSMVRNGGCKECARKKDINNSLAVKKPELAKYWHPTKNGDLTPFDTTPASNDKVWWLGLCGHEWKKSVTAMDRKYRCPFCSGDKILKGYNDMWTINDAMAKLLINSELGHIYNDLSNDIVEWNCPEGCGRTFHRRINDMNRFKSPCKMCSDGTPYTEKLMANILDSLGINFYWDESLMWSGLKRYDFYLPKYNMIIEMHGGQHSRENGFQFMGGKPLNEIIHNDEYKKELAFKNGIKHYIEIDCSKSYLKFIKDNILNSKLNEMFNFDKVDWIECAKNSVPSHVLKIINMYDDGHSINEIYEITSLSEQSIREYLRKGSALYLDEIKIVQLSKQNEFIRVWNNIEEIAITLNIQAFRIRDCCKGKRKTVNGFKWTYLNNYNK